MRSHITAALDTGDLEIWINPKPENASKLVNVLKDFGFGSLGLSTADFLNVGDVTQLGYPPLRIDILNSISGVEFESAYKEKIITSIDELKVNFINLSDFIKNKEATGRAKDMGDIESLRKGKP